MIDAIKTYLEEQCKTDAALAEKYSAEMLPNIIQYITSEARKLLDCKAGAIDNETVYKWARHYVLDAAQGEVDTSDAVVIKEGERKPKAPAVDVEKIKAQAAKEAVDAYKAEERKKAEEAKAKAEEAKRKAEEAKKAKAEAENFVNPNQVDLFGGV